MAEILVVTIHVLVQKVSQTEDFNMHGSMRTRIIDI